MFDLFSDPVKVAQQLEIIMSEYGFAVWETLYPLVLEVIFAYVLGLPMGVLLVTGEKEGIHPLPGWLMKFLNVVINLLRSVPFLILMIIVLPLSKILVGTKVGTVATIPPWSSRPSRWWPGWWRPHCGRWTTGSSKRPSPWALPPGRLSPRSCSLKQSPA